MQKDQLITFMQAIIVFLLLTNVLAWGLNAYLMNKMAEWTTPTE